jgi:hypothetical protein
MNSALRNYFAAAIIVVAIIAFFCSQLFHRASLSHYLCWISFFIGLTYTLYLVFWYKPTDGDTLANDLDKP